MTAMFPALTWSVLCTPVQVFQAAVYVGLEVSHCPTSPSGEDITIGCDGIFFYLYGCMYILSSV